MTEFFLAIVNMSISASWLVLAVLLLRVLLKKAPKWINVLLWGIVAIRLVCPFSIESALSLIPSVETINPEVALNPPAIDSGVQIIDNVINPVIGETTISFQPEKDLNLFQFIMPYLAGLWLAGIVVLLVYTLVSYLRLKSKIGTAVLLRDNIFQSENVASPFVLGIIKPKIYLPFNISEQDKELVIAHENAHIKRKDHLWKPLGFLILTLHWFNPLVWLGYVLLCRDIELACDERVVKELSNELRADYSQALLTCSINRRMIAACPLAFGEVSVKDRVKSVLSYKKPAFWIVGVAIVASIAVAVCFLTNPKTEPKEYYDSGYSLWVIDETYKGTTQLPDKTETFSFDYFNGTKGKLSNGARFEITECNLQSGSLTIKLSGKALYSTTVVEPVVMKEIVVEEGSNGVVLTDKQYNHFFTFSFVRTQSLDEAVSQAILWRAENMKQNTLGTELVSEGHIIYGADVTDKKYKVYAHISYYLWGFENGFFIPKYDSFDSVAMTFGKTASGYELLDIDYVMGEETSVYEKSVKEVFPKKYWNRVLYLNLIDDRDIQKQNENYAQIYLAETGRTEEIRYYNQLELVSLTDVGVTEEASNKFISYMLPYNSDLGYYEAVEDNVRYIYTTAYDERQKIIICTKEVYDTKEIVEKIEIDGVTGEIISTIL